MALPLNRMVQISNNGALFMVILSAAFGGDPLLWVLIASAFGAAGILILSVVIKYWTKERHEPVPEVQKEVMYTVAQIEELREMLSGTGYAYDWKQDIFYSDRNPWQKRFGYCRLYDESTAPLGMVIDCEPVEFEFGGKRWLIELWKGQYGMTTGAEIGIYNTDRPDMEIPGLFTGTFYQCAEEEEYLSMTYTLVKDGQVLFRRAAKHWWLTGFKLGIYSKPSSLRMDASIKFRDEAMQDAFLKGLIKLGYGENEIRKKGGTVQVKFTKPYSKQPRTRKGIISHIALYQNKWFVREYRRLTIGKRNMYDILTLLKERSPLLYTLATKIGRQRELFSQHDMISQYMD